MCVQKLTKKIGFEKYLKTFIYIYIIDIKKNKLFLLFLKIFSYIRITIYFPYFSHTLQDYKDMSSDIWLFN